MLTFSHCTTFLSTWPAPAARYGSTTELALVLEDEDVYFVRVVSSFNIYYAPAPNRWGIKRWFCLSVAYIGPKSRTERSRKTKIGTEVDHVTRDSDTTFNGHKVDHWRSRSPGHFTHRGVYASGSCSGVRGNVLAVGTYCYVAVCRLGGARRFGAHRGRRGAGPSRGGRPPTACFI